MMSLLAAPALAGTVKVETDAVVGLQNEKVSIGFSRETGALVSLKNLVTNDQYLKTPGGDGNIFRAYVDTTEVPPTLATAFPHVKQPVEGALGGILVDANACRLQRYRFQGDAARRELVLHLRHAETQLGFTLTIGLGRDDELTADLTVRNDGPGVRTVLIACPYFTGLSLGNSPERNRAVWLTKWGTALAPAWESSEGVYGRNWNGMWNAVYDVELNEGLGLYTQDKDLHAKIFRRFPGGGFSVLYPTKRVLRSGESFTQPTAVVLVHCGGWKVPARRYGAWLRGAFPMRKPPAWTDDVTQYVGLWIPSPKAVAERKRLQFAEDPTPPQHQLYREKHPDFPIVSPPPPRPQYFTSFSQLPWLYCGNKFTLIEWAQYWEGLLKMEKPAAYHHTDGTYHPRTDLGGVAALRIGVSDVHEIGRYAGFYVAGKTVRKDSDIFVGQDMGDWWYRGAPDRTFPEDAESIDVAPGYIPWQDHLAQLCKRLLRETGAKYIRLDEMGRLYEVSHNPLHHDGNPYEPMQRNLQLYRKVREAMDEVDPEALLFTENVTDVLHMYVDGGLAMWYGQDIAPLRIVLPDLLGFGYGTPQMISALHGYIPGADRALPDRNGWYFSQHHDTIWGPGMEKTAPADYPEENTRERNPVLRWSELSRTFIEACRRGDPTDERPAHPRLSYKDWAATMWRSDAYWLMVCGHRSAITPDEPVRVKLPTLPQDVEHAYEFDTATLTMRDAGLERDETGDYVTVTALFSAVFFPRPDCPPLVVMDDPIESMESTDTATLTLRAFAPWRGADRTLATPRVDLTVPGILAEPRTLELPATVRIDPPTTLLPGHFYLQVTGQTLPLRRWFTVRCPPGE